MRGVLGNPEKPGVNECWDRDKVFLVLEGKEDSLKFFKEGCDRIGAVLYDNPAIIRVV